MKATATKTCFRTTIVLLLTACFGLLTAAQFVSPLQCLSHDDTGGVVSGQARLTRHAIAEVSPASPELSTLYVSDAGFLPNVDMVAPVPNSWHRSSILLNVWPEFGQIPHRRLLNPSADDPEPL